MTEAERDLLLLMAHTVRCMMADDDIPDTPVIKRRVAETITMLMRAIERRASSCG